MNHKVKKLERLVKDGQIKSYSYDGISDTNRNGDDIFYDKLVIIFNDGTKLSITPDKNGEDLDVD